MKRKEERKIDRVSGKYSGLTADIGNERLREISMSTFPILRPSLLLLWSVSEDFY